MRSAAHGRWVAGLVSLLFAATVFASSVPPGVDAVEFEKAARTILCDCGCHPQSVWDCACGRAAEMRDEIAVEMRREDWNSGQLIAAYVDRFGEQIKISPEASGFNLVAWLGPGLGFLGAGLLMLLLLRRWKRSPAAGPSPAPGAADAIGDAPYLDRLRAEMQEYER